MTKRDLNRMFSGESAKAVQEAELHNIPPTPETPEMIAADVIRNWVNEATSPLHARIARLEEALDKVGFYCAGNPLTVLESQRVADFALKALKKDL